MQQKTDPDLVGPFWPFHDIHEERHHLRYITTSPGSCDYLMPE